MADVYAAIDTVDEAVQMQLGDVLELRAADPQQVAMRDAYLLELPLPPGARVLEIGCGTGAISRALAQRPDVAEVVAVDPSPVFVARARRAAAQLAGVTFAVGDGRDLELADDSFDAVVCHTALCHIPGAERVLPESRRVLVPGGSLALFDGDYATTTVALGADDPLQACVEAAIGALVHDPWLVRRLPALVRAAGFEVVTVRSHGYLDSAEPRYMLTVVDRGADALAASGRIGAPAAEALKAEARRRAKRGEFHGHVSYASLIARAV